MRRSTRGIVAFNIKLSISHEPKTGRTRGILLGCSAAQISFIVEQIKMSSLFAGHPLFLPCLLTSCQQEVLSDQTEKLWKQLGQVETISGQTGAPFMNNFKKAPATGSNQKSILGVVQLAAAWESHTNALLLAAEVIKDELSRVKELSPDSRKSEVDGVTKMLAEYMALTIHKSKVMLWDLQYFNTRAQAQTSAVSRMF